MRITNIERQKKNAARKSVFIDDAFAFGISDEILLKFGLHVGAELDAVAVEKILETENEETAKQKAFRFLAIRPRSIKEIRDYLAKKEYAGGIIEQVVEKLNSLKMLNDTEFARLVCRDTLLKKPVGEKMIRQSLFKKGVPSSIVDAVVPEFFSSETESAMALQAAERQWARNKRSSKQLDEERWKKRMLDFLLRRGFGFAAALTATKQIFSGDQSFREK